MNNRVVKTTDQNASFSAHAGICEALILRVTISMIVLDQLSILPLNIAMESSRSF